MFVDRDEPGPSSESFGAKVPYSQADPLWLYAQSQSREEEDI